MIAELLQLRIWQYMQTTLPIGYDKDSLEFTFDSLALERL